MTKRTGLIGYLPFRHRERLLGVGREIRFAAHTRVFERGESATRFWLIRSGAVHLDAHVPGRRHVVVETLGPGDLLGCSWLFHPYRWRFGAVTAGSVHAIEFDAATVRRLCREDTAFGYALTLRCVEIVANRLHAARLRALQPPGPTMPGAPEQGVPERESDSGAGTAGHVAARSAPGRGDVGRAYHSAPGRHPAVRLHTAPVVAR